MNDRDLAATRAAFELIRLDVDTSPDPTKTATEYLIRSGILTEHGGMSENYYPPEQIAEDKANHPERYPE